LECSNSRERYRRSCRRSHSSSFGGPHRPITFFVFTVLSTATVGLIVLYYARRGEAEAHLSAPRDRMVVASPAIFAAISVLVGACLTIDGLLAILGV